MTKTRKKHKKLNLTKSKFRSPTSLSIFPERSPQLQDKEPNVLNAFTTKNIRVGDKNGQPWNTVENNKLAYKRSARGALIGSYPKIIYGSRVDRLTKKNYKKLKRACNCIMIETLWFSEDLLPIKKHYAALTCY